MRKKMIGLYAFACLTTGCVMRQPVIYTRESESVNAQGKKEKILTRSAGNEEQFTPLGNIWNLGTYGTLGALWGIPQGWEEGYTSTNATSFLDKSIRGTTGALTGPFTGLYQGMKYGYNLDYKTGRSVEGKIFDLIEHGTNQAGNFIQDLGR